MNEDDRDPDLQAWFAQAEEDLPAAAFIALLGDETIARERNRRRFRMLAGAAVLAAATGFVYVQQPLLGSLARLLTTAVVNLEPGTTAALLAPLNQVAVVLAAALLAARFVYRRVFS